jgi:hypothetical protein
LRHTAGSTLILIGLLVYTTCAFAATWVYYSFDPRLRLRRFPIVFVAGIAPFLLAAFLGQLLAGLGGTSHGSGGQPSASPRPRRSRAKGPGLAATVLDQTDAARILGRPVSTPRNSDTWWMPRGSIGTCLALEGPGRVDLAVYPRERAPRYVLRRLDARTAGERFRGQLVVTAGNKKWVVSAAARNEGQVIAEEGLGALTQHALDRLQYA